MNKTLTSYCYRSFYCYSSYVIPVICSKTIDRSHKFTIMHAKNKTADYWYGKIDACGEIILIGHKGLMIFPSVVSSTLVRFLNCYPSSSAACISVRGPVLAIGS